MFADFGSFEEDPSGGFAGGGIEGSAQVGSTDGGSSQRMVFSAMVSGADTAHDSSPGAVAGDVGGNMGGGWEHGGKAPGVEPSARAQDVSSPWIRLLHLPAMSKSTQHPTSAHSLTLPSPSSDSVLKVAASRLLPPPSKSRLTKEAAAADGNDEGRATRLSSTVNGVRGPVEPEVSGLGMTDTKEHASSPAKGMPGLEVWAGRFTSSSNSVREQAHANESEVGGGVRGEGAEGGMEIKAALPPRRGIVATRKVLPPPNANSASSRSRGAASTLRHYPGTPPSGWPAADTSARSGDEGRVGAGFAMSSYAQPSDGNTHTSNRDSYTGNYAPSFSTASSLVHQTPQVDRISMGSGSSDSADSSFVIPRIHLPGKKANFATKSLASQSSPLASSSDTDTARGSSQAYGDTGGMSIPPLASRRIGPVPLSAPSAPASSIMSRKASTATTAALNPFDDIPALQEEGDREVRTPASSPGLALSCYSDPVAATVPRISMVLPIKGVCEISL